MSVCACYPTTDSPNFVFLFSISLFILQSFVGRFASGLARRSTVLATKTTQSGRRSFQTVPRLGTEAEMEAEAIAQIRARIAYQKELMAENPHKSHAEEWAELWNWIKISVYFCGPVVIFAASKDLLFEEHHHRKEGVLPEYMGIRKKEFPWECENCDLFDSACWAKCRAEKA